VKRFVIALFMLAPVLAVLPPQAAAAAPCHPGLAGLRLSHASVPGGARLTGTVSLTCGGPSASIIRLQGFTGISAPRTVRVPAHKTAVTFAVTTSVTHAGRHGTIEATLGRAHRRARLTVSRTPRTCRTPALAAATMPRLVYVGDRPTATIRLSCVPAKAVRVSLAGNNPLLPVPRTVTVAGYYRTAAVVLAPRADEAGQYQATLTARLGRTSKSAVLTVNPGLSVVQIPASSEPDAVTLNILFTGELPAGGETVELASSNPAISVPSSFAFTQQGSGGGGVLGITVQAVTKNTPVTLSATLGTVTKRATVTLLPPFSSTDTATLAAENGPGPVYGQEFDLEYILTLSNPAPPDGLSVTFSSPSPDVEIQDTVDVTGGFVNGFADINTANVTSSVHTELDATVDGVTATLPITIEPGLTTLAVPASVTGGQSFTGTVSLAGPVDIDTTVSLQSLEGIVTVPGLVTIPKGQSSVTFTATTVAVDSPTDVGLEASLGTTNVFSTDVTVSPPS
jgi:hypothetical protein